MIRFLFSFTFLCVLLCSLAARAEWEDVSSAGLSVLRYVPRPAMDGTRSLLVVLHGCAQKNEHLMKAGNLSASADRYHTVVLAPQVPNGGVIAGCWDFYGDNHTRTDRMNGVILTLIKEALKDQELQIDANKVYVAGISSGAGEALVLACLAPDVIRGVGLVAGVALGHQARDISRPKIDAETSKESCERLAGEYKDKLLEQEVSIIYGTSDRLVATEHSKLIAKMYSLMRSKVREDHFSLETLAGENTKGAGTRYLDGDTVFMSVIENEGLGHAWPAGVKMQTRTPFVSGNSIDYPDYLLKFFLL